MHLTTHSVAQQKGKTNAYTNSSQIMSQDTLEYHAELKGAMGYPKFSKETVILDICQTRKEHSSQFQHYILLHCFQLCHIQTFEKLDFSLVAIIKKHHTKINAEKVTKVVVSSLIPKFEKLCVPNSAHTPLVNKLTAAVRT